MVFNGIYSNAKARNLAALANQQKYIVLSHGQDTGTNFKMRRGSAVIFVPPQYAILSKQFALNTVSGFNLFKDNNKLKKFMKFEYPEDMYFTKTGNNTHFMEIFVGGQSVPDLNLTFANNNKKINNKVGVWKLPINSRTSMPIKPYNGIDKLSQIVNSVPGVYFVFACRSQVCPRGIRKILQMTGGGLINTMAARRPLVGANRLHFNNMRTALNNINTGTNNARNKNIKNMSINNSNTGNRATRPMGIRRRLPVTGGVRKPKIDKSRLVTMARRRAAMARRKNRLKTVGYNGNTNRPPKRSRANNNVSRPPKRSRANNNVSRPPKRSRANNNGTIVANLVRVMKEPPTKQRLNKVMTLLARMPNNGNTVNLSKKFIPEFRG